MGKYHLDDWADDPSARPSPRWLRRLLSALFLAVAVGSVWMVAQCLPNAEPPAMPLESLGLSDRLPFPDVAAIHQTLRFAHRLAYRRGFRDGVIVGAITSLILVSLTRAIGRIT